MIDELKNNIIIVLSWGSRNFKTVQNGLEFTVNGFLYEGVVQITRDNNNYSIKLASSDIRLNNICLKDVVEIVDSLVEKDCSNEEYAILVNKKYDRV